MEKRKESGRKEGAKERKREDFDRGKEGVRKKRSKKRKREDYWM